MENKKTCGECKHMSVDCLYCKKHLSTLASLDQVSPFCSEWEPKTNGDKIRQMSNKGIAAFVCGVLNDRKEETFLSVLDLLNAPAVCVKHDTQTDLCIADNTESEVKNE